MNEFLFWCKHPLVPFLFHEVTSLHPPSFQRNDFSTCNNYDDDDDTKIQKSRVSKFSRGELKVYMRYYGVCTARYEPVSYCWSVSKAS